MLRITRIVDAGEVETIKLEGKLLGPWVDEVRKACTPGTALSGCTRLDLSAVTFVDAAGAALLRELIRQGVEITAWSSFVAGLLNLENRG